MEMDDSLYQSISVKKTSKQIKKKKVKYINLTIFFLLIHCICFVIQKLIEIISSTEDSENPNDINKSRNIYNYFLIGEDIFITLFIIISLCKINNDSIILFCLLYIVLAIIMIFYFIIDNINDNPNIINDTLLLTFYIINIVLFLVEGILLFLCSEIMEKEKIQVKREKYGYKNKNNINQ